MRITTVAKAQKDQGSCGVCHEPIHKGDSYRWIKPRYGGKRVRHATCQNFRPSDMTSSDKLSRLYAAQENVEDFLSAGEFDSLDDVKGVLEEAGSEAREVGDEYRESAQNIEDGFGTRTAMCDEIEEKADSCDSWADTLEGALDYVDDWDEDNVRGEVEPEVLADYLSELDLPTDTEYAEALDLDGFDAEVYAERVNSAIEEKKDEWRGEVTSAADDAVGSLEL